MHESDGVEVAKAADALADGKVDEIVIADDDEPATSTTRKKPKTTSSTWSLPEGVEGVFEPSVAGTRLQGGQSVCRRLRLPLDDPTDQTQPFQKAAHRMTVDQLSAKYMVPVRRSILSVFMTRDSVYWKQFLSSALELTVRYNDHHRGQAGQGGPAPHLRAARG